MAELPRLKPDPIPVIHPVPELAVSGARAAVYERTKEGLGSPGWAWLPWPSRITPVL